MRERFARSLAAQPDLVPGGATVLVALSGGPDSTALLHLLHECSPRHDLRLVAAHFDHAVRAESALEAERLAAHVARLGLRCVVGRPPVPLKPAQDALRAARYEWLEATRREVGALRIATGHQADDQAETVLFRIMRGTGVRGLAGIPCRRGVIVRPLLAFRRADLLGYVESLGVPWTEDPSNENPRWIRSRIRGLVLPGLQERDETTLRLIALASCAARVEELLERLAEHVVEEARVPPDRGGWRRVELDRGRLQSVGPELQARVIRRIARQLGSGLSRGGTRAAVEFMSRGLSGARVTIGGGLEVRREFDRFAVTTDDFAERDAVAVQPLEVPVGSPGGGRLRIGGRALRVTWRPADDLAPARPGRIAVPVARGHYPLRFRGWRAGDRMRLAGGTRKLKKIFNEHRVPRSARSSVPVLEDREGRVLWAVGLAVAAPRPSTEHEAEFLEFELRDE